jgi:hypothetical protein
MLAVLYLLLLIPEREFPKFEGAGKEAFAWNRDAFWSELESRLREARLLDETNRTARLNHLLREVEQALEPLTKTSLVPKSPEFAYLEARFFQLAPVAAVCSERLPNFMNVAIQMSQLVKKQSEDWPMDSAETRAQLYRLLYGRRAAVEEVLLQSKNITNTLELHPVPDNVAVPSVEVHGVKVHSGDILVSRGGAATSALIARGYDFPGNFSHIALVHVDDATKKVSVIESHIESGVGVFPFEKYLDDTKLHIMVLRLRMDLPQLVADPSLPHKAASLAMSNTLARHIPYDFAMNHNDHSKMFCSEVASSAYAPFGIKLWTALSHLSTYGVTSWLGMLGVRHFVTQEPSDLEYDPQLSVVAEWRDPQTLFNDHVDNAVLDVMLEGAERGEELEYNLWMLPFARVAKGWSVLLNHFEKVGPVPEGMSATTALRVKGLTARHAAMKARLLEKAEEFETEKGYVPPYWELVRMGRETSNIQ